MVTETKHLRSRRAALGGLLLQLAATVAFFALWLSTRSLALGALSWFTLAGVPIWFVALLVFRQKELAALEALDLEQLQREKAATGGGEALFGEQGESSGFRVAAARLQWMERWLLPLFGIITATALLVFGAVALLDTRRFFVDATVRWHELRGVDIGLILCAVVTICLFFFSRFATGLARVSEWQLLRGCGAFMLGNVLAGAAITIAFGLKLYQNLESVEHWLTLIIPAFMILLGAEMAINVVLDVYRPRTRGVEVRAPFDSRILGLFSEPGGVGQSVAEALKYQFGFEVSQSWFYQLLQRTFVPLAGVATLIVWLLSCIVIVHPQQNAIVELFGQQLDPQHPLGPGIHFKAPYPFATVERFDTGRIHEFVVGFRSGDAALEDPSAGTDASARPAVELWTDPKHLGREHFNFIIAPPRSDESTASAPAGGEPGTGTQRAPVHLVRAHVVVQYRLRADQLDRVTRNADDPHRIIRALAWEEITRYNAAATVDAMMSSLRAVMGAELLARIAARTEAARLGLEIVHVSVLGVHPESTAAVAFRQVVTAQQDKVAEIRRARVQENQLLSQAVGDVARAVSIGEAITAGAAADRSFTESDRALRRTGGPDAARFEEALAAAEAYRAVLTARLDVDVSTDQLTRAHEEFDLGMGRSPEQLRQAEQHVAQQAVAERSAADAWESAIGPWRERVQADFGAEAAEQAVLNLEARIAQRFWNDRLDGQLVGLEGEAAVRLARARAQRWQREMKAAGEVSLLQNERFAYRANPRVYRMRTYLEALVNGLSGVRKFFFAFDPGTRHIKLRLNAEDQARPDLTGLPTKEEQ